MELKHKYLPKGKTSKKWLKDVTDFYITSSLNDDIRDIKNIKENHEVLTGMMKKSYFEKTLNPLNLPQTESDVPLNEEVIPIILPTINTLIGEMYDRDIDFKAYVANPDAVSKKEEWLKSEFNKRLDAIVKDRSLSQDEIKLKLMELKQWKEYDAQDIRERFANHLLNDFITRYNFQQVTKEGWKEHIGNAQEAYLFDIVKNNLIFENINPEDLRIYGLPKNGHIHESEAIVYTRYMTISEVVTKYGEYLEKKQLDEIIRGGSEGDVNNGIMMIMDNVFSDKEPIIGQDENKLFFDDNANDFINKTDRMGNKILVRTVYFKVLRKINVLHYIDEVTGEEQVKDVDMAYELNEVMGEWFDKPKYISEYWQSTKILNNIYVDQKRCPVQMRDMNNPSLVKAPIIGKVFKVGNLQAKSIVDYLKPIQYQWTIFSKKVSLLWSRNLGKLVRLDISKIPKKYGFDLDLFMSWVTSFGIIVEDPWNEAMKGQPAGQFGSAMQAVDMELSSSISQALNYMMYLRSLADEVIGVNRQRKGDLMASDGLGTTQESINHSLKITEEMFQEHHLIQQQLLYYMLEYGKHILKEGDGKKMQYITDSNIYELYQADKTLYNDIDYGIFINNSKKQRELEQVFLQLAHAYAQNGAIKMSEIMELYNTKSMSSRINKLKLKEKEQELQMQKAEEDKRKQEQQMQQMVSQLEQEKHQREMQLQQLKNEGIVMVAQIQAGAKIEAEQIQAETSLKETDIKSNTDITKTLYQYEKQKTKQNKK